MEYIKLSPKYKGCHEEEAKIINEYQLDYYSATDTKLVQEKCMRYPHELMNPKEVIRIVDKLFDKTWRVITSSLNRYNQLKVGEAFWEFYSSYDFYSLCCIYYERYILIKNAINTYNDVTFLIDRNEDEFYIAKVCKRGIIDYEKIINSVDWQIINYLQIAFVEGKVTSDNKEVARKYSDKKVVDGLKKILLRVCGSLFWNAKYIIYTGQVSFFAQLKLMMKHHGQLIFGDSDEEELPCLEIDFKYRLEEIKRKDYFPESEFEDIFFSNLFLNLPVVFLENFADVYRRRLSCCDRNNRIIKINGYDETKMMNAALVYDNGGKVINAAHCMEESFVEATTKTDYLCKGFLHYTNTLVREDTSMFSVRCSNLAEISPVSYKDNKELLYVVSSEVDSCSRWVNSLNLRSVENLLDYAMVPNSLYDNISNEYKAFLCFRIRDSFDRKIKEYLQSNFTEANIDDGYLSGGLTLIEKIRSARIVICETLYTTSFFEAIFSGVPVIVVNCKSYYEIMTCDIVDLEKKLRSVGIIYSNGKEAAEFINRHYVDIDDWWNEEERKNIVREVKELCLSGENETEVDWLKDLIKKGMKGE